MIKIFAHRGYLLDKNNNILPQNSMASFYNAIDFGFNKIEFDLWLINNELIISHDYPKIISTCPKFIDYLCFQNQLEYWLDFKNIDENNIDQIVDLIKINIDQMAINYQQIFFAPYCLNYDLTAKIKKKLVLKFNQEINFVAVCDDYKQFDKLLELLVNNNIKYVSIDHKLLNNEVINKFKNIEFLAWTVNDQESFEYLKSIGIKIFASDCLIR